MLGRCPKCDSEVLEGEQDFYCRSSECKFRIGGVVLGQVIHRSQVVKLLADKRTDLLSDFVVRRIVDSSDYDLKIQDAPFLFRRQL